MRITVNLPDVTREKLAEEGRGVELPKEGSLTLYYRADSPETELPELQYLLRWANFATGRGKIVLHLTKEEFEHLAAEVTAEVERTAKGG